MFAKFSSHLRNGIKGREDIALFPGPTQLFVTCSTASDGKHLGMRLERTCVAMEINETLGNKDAQSECGELWVVKPASESNATFPQFPSLPSKHLGMRLQMYLQNGMDAGKLPGILYL